MQENPATVNEDFDDVTDVAEDELSALKSRADMMGIRYHPSIGIDTLREKINVALAEKPKEKEEIKPVQPVEAPRVMTEKEKYNELVTRKRKEAAELVRINVTCMNPNKREWEGEIFTAGNSVVGTFKKYVPFNTSDGWHVPRIIYNQIIQRKCQVFYTMTDKRGNQSRTGKLINEFSVEVLPNLTPKELEKLAQRQAMAKGNSLDD